MKPEKKKDKSQNKEETTVKKKREKSQRISLYEARLGEFIHAISLINTIEAHWDTQEIILSFDKKENMVPFMFLIDCVFASKNGSHEQMARN
ncbi:MAG: hypothetical protein ISS01_00445 [Nanoarchaeota archaeon]|nr:hypothetical protein [Nanoarchaeota archaeon]